MVTKIEIKIKKFRVEKFLVKKSIENKKKKYKVRIKRENIIENE